jgi:hypothetical protein
VKRLFVAAALLAAVAAMSASSAGATNECRGLPVCVRVAGPWVVVPAAQTTPRPRVDFQLSCPRGYVIGGLDAELTDRAINIDFLGKLGSPVNPGVTTARSALFRGTYTGNAPKGPSFRPHLGCLPSSGGGAGPVPRRTFAAAFPPGEPTTNRVRTVSLRPGLVRAAVSCSGSEHLISAWHAVAFYTQSAPSQALIRSVSATRSVQGRRVGVQVRSTVAVQGARGVLQVGAVCGGGS